MVDSRRDTLPDTSQLFKHQLHAYAHIFDQLGPGNLTLALDLVFHITQLGQLGKIPHDLGDGFVLQGLVGVTNAYGKCQAMVEALAPGRKRHGALLQ